MGWTFHHGATERAIIRHLLSTDHHATVSHAKCGPVLWAVKRSAAHDYIACFLLDHQAGYGWGYKDLCESMHPYQYNCPLSFLERVPVACEQWRAGVRQFHAECDAEQASKIERSVIEGEGLQERPS